MDCRPCLAFEPKAKLNIKQHFVLFVVAAVVVGSRISAIAQNATNTALVPAPRDFPTNWLARHAENVAAAKRGGIDILFLGDSITDGWHWDTGGRKIWEKTFAPRHAANFGIGYDRIQNVLWRIENGELNGIDPKVVVLLIGTNNTGNEDDGRPRNSTPEIIEGISNLVRQIQFRLPRTKIVLFGIFPRGDKNDPIRAQVREVNAGISKLASDNVRYLDIGAQFLAPDGTLPRDMFPDSLHPNEKGYQIWADAITPVLDEILGKLSAEQLLPLKVVGTKILDSSNRPVLLRGVNAASMEWTSDGQGRILKTVNTAIRDWRVNIIRLPLAQDRWFGRAREQTDGGRAYRELVHEVVDTCATQHCYIILDLHWSDCNEWGVNIGQHSMPDLNSVAFWKDFAPVYANNPAVLFDLYNEPHDVSWNVWLNGGRIKDKPNTRQVGPARTYECVGMQKLLDTVRETGASNVVIAGGLDWAYDFSGILRGYRLLDPHGNGVIYANHCYDNKRESVKTWVRKMEQASAKLPVIVSEFGGDAGPSRVVPSDNWLLRVMKALNEHHWSWVAWDLHTSARPNLISDWDYTPSPQFGVYVKQALAEPPSASK